MRGILSLLVGFGLGGLIAVVFVRLLPGTPAFKARLQEGWRDSLADARAAAAQRRAELEAELAEKMKFTKSPR